jgi:hypothetical protein
MAIVDIKGLTKRVKAHQEAAIEYARFPESTEDREKLITTAIELVKVLMTGDDGKAVNTATAQATLAYVIRASGSAPNAAAFDLIKRKPFAYIFELAASRAVTEQISRKPASKPRRRAKKGRKR